MNAKDLKVGDRLRITGVPTNYKVPPLTEKVFKQLAARKRSVRINKVDENGIAWYSCKFKRPDGTWVYHDIDVLPGEDNWVLVKKRGV